MNLTTDYGVLPFGEREIHWSLSHNIKGSIDAIPHEDLWETCRRRRITHHRGIWPQLLSQYLFLPLDRDFCSVNFHIMLLVPQEAFTLLNKGKMLQQVCILTRVKFTPHIGPHSVMLLFSVNYIPFTSSIIPGTKRWWCLGSPLPLSLSATGPVRETWSKCTKLVIIGNMIMANIVTLASSFKFTAIMGLNFFHPPSWNLSNTHTALSCWKKPREKSFESKVNALKELQYETVML